MSIEKALIATDPATILREADAVRTKFLLSLADKKSDDELSADEPEEEVIAGPLDPEFCTVTGNGTAGGEVGQSLFLTVRTRDSNNIPLKIGGASVVGRLIGGEKSTENTTLSIDVADCDDGSYKLSYTVP